MVEAGLAEGVISRGVERGLLDIKVHDLRDYTTDRHRSVDDVPYGGGPGMVMKPEPLARAVEDIRARRGNPDTVVLLSPQGRRFTQAEAARMSALRHVALLCGRYEGMDERVRTLVATEELSIGDYVLSGGELPALVIVDAISRLVPGVVGDSPVGGRGLVFARAARLPALHASVGVFGREGARRADVGPPRSRSGAGGRRRRFGGRSSAGPSCWTWRRWTTRSGRCWTRFGRNRRRNNDRDGTG